MLVKRTTWMLHWRIPYNECWWWENRAHIKASLGDSLLSVLIFFIFLSVAAPNNEFLFIYELYLMSTRANAWLLYKTLSRPLLNKADAIRSAREEITHNNEMSEEDKKKEKMIPQKWLCIHWEFPVPLSLTLHLHVSPTLFPLKYSLFWKRFFFPLDRLLLFT